PVTIYYAFKQSETESNGEGGTASTGWDTFLEAVIHAGFAITGTWPMRTERGARSIGIGTNASPPALSSSAARAQPTRPPRRAASFSLRSRPSYPRRLFISSAATSRQWILRRRPLVQAWRSLHDTRRCSTPREN